MRLPWRVPVVQKDGQTLLTTSVAAAAAGITVAGIRQLKRRGVLKYYGKQGREALVDLAELNAYIDARSPGATKRCSHVDAGAQERLRAMMRPSRQRGPEDQPPARSGPLVIRQGVAAGGLREVVSR